jgi:hypothetical protein
MTKPTPEISKQYRLRKSGKIPTPRCPTCNRRTRKDSQHLPLCGRCWQTKTSEGLRQNNSTNYKRLAEKKLEKGIDNNE